MGRSLRARGGRFVAAVACVVAVVVGGFVATNVAQAAVTGTAGEYVPSQGRILDTRNGIGGFTTPMQANVPRLVQVTGTAAVPASSVTAVQVIVSAVDPTSQGVLSGGADGGSTTALMVYDGTGGGNTSNSATLAVPSDGKIQISTQTAVNVVVDVQGYYTAGNGTTAPGGYSPVAGSRIVDTREGIGAPVGKISTGQVVAVQATGVGGVPAGAAAVYVNIMVRNYGPSALLTPYAADKSAPNIALDIPSSSTQALPIGAQIALSPSGAFKLHLNGHNSTTIDLFIDVEGYFTAGSSTGSFTPAAGRLYDSRVAPHVTVKANQTITVPIGGQAGVPSTGDGLEAAVVNLTALDGHIGGGYARAWADGTSEPNPFSEINYSNSIQTNLLTVPVGTDGAIEIHNISSDAVDFVVDLEGFYQSTSTTLCAKDTDSILGTAATSSTTIGADQGSPVVSAVVANSLNESVNAEVYLVDSSGHPVSGSPVEAGVIDNGRPLIYHLPTDNMTVGASYTWWIHVYQTDGCAPQATSAHRTFTLGATPSVPTTTPSTLTITGTALTTATASSGAGDCTGSPCALTPGALALGNDGTTQRISAIKADLSSVPAGARITEATLNITPSCFSSSCMTGTLSIAEADTDVAAAASGADVAAIETQPAATFTEDSSTSSYDITSVVQDWNDGSNNGAVLTETNSNSGTTGESFEGPSGSSHPASITIDYDPATVPGPVTNLTTTAGDGGLIAAWAAPTDTGWYDNTGATDGITNYTVAVTQGTTSVATQTVTTPRAVFTGLSNGTSYTVAVTANTSVGAGTTMTSSSVAPVAVTGGPAKYIADVRDLLTAQDALEAGTAQSTQDATAGATDSAAVSAALGVNATALESVFANEYASSQAETTDTTTLSNTLAVQTGNTVTVYTTATENFTTADTSSGSEVDVPGTAVEEPAVQFTSSSTAPAYLATVDAAGLIEPVTPATGDTLSAPPPDSDTTTSSLSQTNTQESQFTVNTSLAATRLTVNTASSRVNRNSIATWAYNKGTLWDWDPLFGGDDCTDFVSRAMHFGGGLTEVVPARSQWASHDSNRSKWYDVGLQPKSRTNIFSWGHYYSKTWSVAPWSYAYQISRGGRPVARSAVRPGDIAYVNFYGSSASGIDHAAIVTQVHGTNPYVAQQSSPHQAEPIWKAGSTQSWQSGNAKMTPFFIDTSGER